MSRTELARRCVGSGALLALGLAGCIMERQAIDMDVPRLANDVVFAFSSVRDGNGEVYVSTVGTVKGKTRIRRLTYDSAFDGSPAWSPNGFQIAFDADRAGNRNRDIYVMRADGSNVRRLTDDPGLDYAPAWSPDGDWIAFVSTRDSEYDPRTSDADAFRGQIYRIHPDGTGLERLTTSGKHDQYPAWSPDGLRIAFCRDEDGNGDVYVLDLETGVETRLTRSPSFDCNPAWSPDGERIAYSSYSEMNSSSRLLVMGSDGSGVEAIRAAVRNAFEPSWSPDGDWICVTGEDGRGRSHVFAVSVMGGPTRRLTSGLARHQNCEFLPAGAGHY